jgi:hypothetical protein
MPIVYGIIVFAVGFLFGSFIVLGPIKAFSFNIPFSIKMRKIGVCRSYMSLSFYLFALVAELVVLVLTTWAVWHFAIEYLWVYVIGIGLRAWKNPCEPWESPANILDFFKVNSSDLNAIEFVDYLVDHRPEIVSKLSPALAKTVVDEFVDVIAEEKGKFGFPFVGCDEDLLRWPKAVICEAFRIHADDLAMKARYPGAWPDAAEDLRSVDILKIYVGGFITIDPEDRQAMWALVKKCESMCESIRSNPELFEGRKLLDDDELDLWAKYQQRWSVSSGISELGSDAS